MDENKTQQGTTLPSPSANFTLPSLYDDLELDCRLYFPRRMSQGGAILAQGFAIFAHPYAPLGGCYDDPVVNSVGSVLLRQGYILITFNFRGADQSPGKTSWSGRGELGDYVAVYAFCLSLINTPGVLEHVWQEPTMDLSSAPVLLLGGYSYGSMIAAHLPSVQLVGDCLLNASHGSSEKEIESRAHELGLAFLGYCESHQLRGREGRKVSDTASLGGAAVTVGGYGSLDAGRRISRDRSLRKVEVDRVRHSVERVRRKLTSRRSDSPGRDPRDDGAVETRQAHAIVVPRLHFLLVSPLLGSVASLATMFSRLKFERRGITGVRDLPSTAPEEALASNSSLIIYGTADHFTSAARIKAWCERVEAKPGSLLVSREVPGAGHFWHSAANEEKLTILVTEWVEKGSHSSSNLI